MQCHNCQFENMPGVNACGRCGASLQLAAMAIDVHPPRASRAAKFRRRWFPLGHYATSVGGAVRRVLPAARLPDWPADLPPPGVLGRALVPGWAQRTLGRVGRARWMFYGFFGSLFLGLLMSGSLTGWVLVGLAVAIQAASIVDVVAGPASDLRQRLIYALVAIAVLGLFIYYPAGRLLSLVASPVQFNVAAPPFSAGDVVLVNASAYLRSGPQVGDVVLYGLLERQMPVLGVRYRGEPEWYRLAGDRIDRVLAVAGQKVACQGGKLLVDGRLSLRLPLNPWRLPEGLEVTVPPGCYLIIPSADVQTFPFQVLRAASIVPREQIRGRVYLRSYPLWRLAIIR